MLDRSKSFELGKYKTVRLKPGSLNCFLHILLIIIVSTTSVTCNRPPRFLIDGQSEIVLRLRESPEAPVGRFQIRQSDSRHRFNKEIEFQAK